MRAICLLVLSLSMACSGFTLPAPAQPPSPPRVQSAVGRVLDATVALEDETGRSYCTGSFVRNMVVTANHCVDQAPDGVVNVRLRDGRDARAMVVSADEALDVAVLGLLSPLPGRAEIELAPGEAQPGDRVFAVGMPLQWRWFITQGIAAGVHDVVPGEGGIPGLWLLHSAATSYGNSGGPVLNEYGEMVGVTSWVKLVGGVPNHMSAACPVSAVETVLH